MSVVIEIDEHSPKPIYVQIQDCIIHAVRDELIGSNAQLPSINEVAEMTNVARKTVEKSYNELKRKNIIVSVPGKGFFVSEDNNLDRKKVMLMFDIMNSQNNLIHRAFMQAINDHTLIDFLVYHKDPDTFIDYLIHAPDEYSHYIIMGHFSEQEQNAIRLINRLPKHKLVVIDRDLAGIQGAYSSIIQNFEDILYHALKDLGETLSKYNQINVVFPEFTYYPKATLDGISKFAEEFGLTFNVVENIKTHVPKSGSVFLALTENELAATVLNIQQHDFVIAQDIGIISYTDHPLNEILIGGITAILPDFEDMGQLAAEVVINGKKINTNIAYRIIERKSL